MKHSLLLASFASVVAVAVEPTVADACGNEVFVRIDPNIAILKEADRLVDNGNPSEAMNWVQKSTVLPMKKKPGEGPLSDRALQVLARAAVRSDGAVFPGIGATPTESERAASKAWAVKTLRAFDEKTPTDPQIDTLLAEALASQPEGRAEARRTLLYLAKKDMVTSAFGYAALAKVAGSPAGTPAPVAAPVDAMMAGTIALAKLRCETRSKDKGICVGKPESPAKPNSAELNQVRAHNASGASWDRF
jgi:hypothetical protein